MPQAQLLRPIIGLPEAAYYDAYIDGGDSVRSIGLMLETDGNFRAISEPATQLNVFRMIHTLESAIKPHMAKAMQNLVRNECCQQMVLPDQKNIARAKAVLRGIEFSAMCMHPLMYHAEWVGDRELTLACKVKGAAEVRALWGGKYQNAWVVPAKAQRAGTRKRERLERCAPLLAGSPESRSRAPHRRGPASDTWRRYQGFMQVDEMSDDNELAYCKESKELQVTLALSFIGSNLQFVDGAALPPPPQGMVNPKWDMVTRTWFGADTALPATLARVRAHLGEA